MTPISACLITAGELTLEAAVASVRPHVAIAVQVGRVADAVGRPRACAGVPEQRPAKAAGYPPPPDSTSAFYVPPGRGE